MSQEKFKIRTRTQILFGTMFALLLGAVLIRFNFANAQVRLWVQVGLILLVMLLGLLEVHRINRGLQRLAKVAESIGQGDFSARAASGNRDALGLVGTPVRRRGSTALISRPSTRNASRGSRPSPSSAH